MVAEPPHAPPPPPRKSAAMPILLALAIGVLALAGVATWLLLHRNDSGDSSNPIATVTVTTPAATTFATPTTTVRPTTTTERPTVTVAPPAPLTGSVSGADGQGFLTPAAARCNSTNAAVAIGRTTRSLVVVCQTGVGRYYYKGVRASDGSGIELDDPVRTASGFTATNPTDDTQYRITASALTIVGRNGQVLATEPMLEFAYRR